MQHFNVPVIAIAKKTKEKKKNVTLWFGSWKETPEDGVFFACIK